jgi:hypothetical protein
MFRNLLRKKRVFIALSVLGVLGIAGVVLAYLSTTGSGSGTGTVTATTSDLTLTSSVPDLTKLGDSQTITVKAANDGSSPQAVPSVNITVSPQDSSCPDGSFSVGDSGADSDDVSSGVEVLPGGAATTIATDTVHFNDNSTTAQDSCVSGGYDIDLSTP